MPNAQPINRVYDEPGTHYLAGGTTVPTSWTTVHTVPTGHVSIVKWVSYVSTDATSYTLQMRLQNPAGTNIEIAQAQLTADGEQWRPIKEVTSLPLTSGWKIQHIGSGAGTINVCHMYSILTKPLRKQ